MTWTPRSGAVALAAFLLLAACGDDHVLPAAGPAAAGVPALPPVSAEERARFALDRLVHGPLPRTQAFAIPQIHALNIENARRDLLALRPQALALLSDPALREALTRPDVDRNPWHNVLEVLAGMEDAPADLVVAWCEPVLWVRDLPLDRRAVRALAQATDSPAVSALLLRFLAERPRDHEVAPVAFRLLAARGSPWRERALEIVLRWGSQPVWERAPTDLARVPGGDAALAWFALLADVSGPLEMRGTGRTVRTAFFAARLLLDDAVWPRGFVALEAAGREGRVLAPATVLDAAGFLPVLSDASPVLAWREALLSGRLAAAEARCALATEGHAAFRATVLEDLSSDDAALQTVAHACPVSTNPADDLESAREVVALFVEDLRAGRRPGTTGVLGALGTVAGAQPAEAATALEEVLRTARPAGEYKEVLEGAHDLLRTLDEDRLRAIVRDLALSGNAEDREVGLLLIRRGRDPAYVATLDRLLESVAPAGRAALRRLAVWVWTAPDAYDEAARRAFATRYARWIDEAPDAEAQVLAPGLLDLGAPGAHAYAAGLGGKRRAVYIQGLLRRFGIVPPEVIEALLAPVDATTAPGERHAALIAVYRTAPPEAAPLVAAMRARLAPPDRAEVDDVLEVVRHRTRSTS